MKYAMKKLYYGYIVAVAAFMFWLIAWGTYSTFSIFLVPIITDFGWKRADIALAYSMSSVVQAVCALGMGRLTDRLGPRFVIAFFGSFIAFSYYLLSKCVSLWHFQVTYAVIGAIGFSTVTVPIMTTIARWFDEKRGMVSGVVQSGMGVGGFIFAPLTGWMILCFGWRVAYYILGIVTLPLTLLVGFLLRRDPGDRLEVGLDSTSKADEYTEGKNKSKKKATILPKNKQMGGLALGKAIQTSQFWMVAVMFLSFGFCRCTFLAHMAAHVQDLGYSLAIGANVTAALTISSMLGRVGLGILGDHIGNRRAYLASFLVMIVALFCGKYATHLRSIFIFAILFGIAWGGQAVLRFTFSAEMFGLGALGAITGTLGLTEAIGAAFGSYFAGYTFDKVGSYSIMFTLGLVLSLFGGMMCYCIKPLSKDSFNVKSVE
jgi:MFS family permease